MHSGETFLCSLIPGTLLLPRHKLHCFATCTHSTCTLSQYKRRDMFYSAVGLFGFGQVGHIWWFTLWQELKQHICVSRHCKCFRSLNLSNFNIQLESIQKFASNSLPIIAFGGKLYSYGCVCNTPIESDCLFWNRNSCLSSCKCVGQSKYIWSEKHCSLKQIQYLHLI